MRPEKRTEMSHYTQKKQSSKRAQTGVNKNGIEVPTVERIEEALSKAESMDDFFGKEGIMSKLFARTLEQMLEGELTAELGYKAAQGIFYRQAEARIEQVETRPVVRRLGVDEISLKKGHRQFMLVLSDLDRHCVIATLADRRMETLEAWFDQLSEAERKAIEEVSMDMWSGYRSAVQHKLPHAQIVVDRFHVAQNLNRVVTKARRDIQRDASDETKQTLKGSRWVLLKNQANLSDDEMAKLELLYQTSPDLKQLHLLKEAFRDIFEDNQSRDLALTALDAWIEKVRTAKLKALNPFLNTLDNWYHFILNYFNQRTSQGFVEGMNNKIKLIMRRGFGYRNFNRFSIRILIECGLIL